MHLDWSHVHLYVALKQKKAKKKYSDFLFPCSFGSLTVKLALEFTLIVSEASVIDTLRTAATNNNFGELALNASSIKGILVIESTVMPPTGKTTATSSVYDGMT